MTQHSIELTANESWCSLTKKNGQYILCVQNKKDSWEENRYSVSTLKDIEDILSPLNISMKIHMEIEKKNKKNETGILLSCGYETGQIFLKKNTLYTQSIPNSTDIFLSDIESRIAQDTDPALFPRHKINTERHQRSILHTIKGYRENNILFIDTHKDSTLGMGNTFTEEAPIGLHLHTKPEFFFMIPIDQNNAITNIFAPETTREDFTQTIIQNIAHLPRTEHEKLCITHSIKQKIPVLYERLPERMDSLIRESQQTP